MLRSRSSRVLRRCCGSTWTTTRFTLMSSRSSGRCIVSSFLTPVYAVGLNFCVGSERSLPRAQRRGAVIILGMLALARRSVVADRVETLVKIGLGKLGQVRIYTISRTIAHTSYI